MNALRRCVQHVPAFPLDRSAMTRPAVIIVEQAAYSCGSLVLTAMAAKHLDTAEFGGFAADFAVLILVSGLIQAVTCEHAASSGGKDVAPDRGLLGTALLVVLGGTSLGWLIWSQWAGPDWYASAFSLAIIHQALRRLLPAAGDARTLLVSSMTIPVLLLLVPVLPGHRAHDVGMWWRAHVLAQGTGILLLVVLARGMRGALAAVSCSSCRRWLATYRYMTGAAVAALLGWTPAQAPLVLFPPEWSAVLRLASLPFQPFMQLNTAIANWTLVSGDTVAGSRRQRIAASLGYGGIWLACVLTAVVWRPEAMRGAQGLPGAVACYGAVPILALLIGQRFARWRRQRTIWRVTAVLLLGSFTSLGLSALIIGADLGTVPVVPVLFAYAVMAWLCPFFRCICKEPTPTKPGGTAGSRDGGTTDRAAGLTAVSTSRPR